MDDVRRFRAGIDDFHCARLDQRSELFVSGGSREWGRYGTLLGKFGSGHPWRFDDCSRCPDERVGSRWQWSGDAELDGPV